jgi:hypothetical protein
VRWGIERRHQGGSIVKLRLERRRSEEGGEGGGGGLEDGGGGRA